LILNNKNNKIKNHCILYIKKLQCLQKNTDIAPSVGPIQTTLVPSLLEQYCKLISLLKHNLLLIFK